MSSACIGGYCGLLAELPRRLRKFRLWRHAGRSRRCAAPPPRIFTLPPGKQEMADVAMGNARFFSRSGPHPLEVVAHAACGTAQKLDLMIEGITPLQTVGPNEVSFLDNRRFVTALKETMAGAVIVHPDMEEWVPEATVPILTTEPHVGWAQVATLFHPVPPVAPGIHPSAVVAESAVIDPSAEIGPLCVIEAGAEIGPGCRIGPAAVIGKGVVIGRDCRIGAHVSLSHALLGVRVYVYPGVPIGQEGFGFAPTKTGFLTAPQLGRVVIEDDVEIGANTTIDRGSTQDTVIGAGSRLDNLVQIGHNVVLGRCCVVVAQAGIAGSTVLEDFVQIGGQAALDAQDWRRRPNRRAGRRHVGHPVRRRCCRIPRPAETGFLPASGGAQAAGTEKIIGDAAPRRDLGCVTAPNCWSSPRRRARPAAPRGNSACDLVPRHAGPDARVVQDVEDVLIVDAEEAHVDLVVEHAPRHRGVVVDRSERLQAAPHRRSRKR